PITPEGVMRGAVPSPDGAHVVTEIGGAHQQFSVLDGSARPLPWLTSNDQVLRYSTDGRSLWTRRRNSHPVRIEQVDLITGARRALLPEFSMPRPGVRATTEVALADDPRSFVYTERELSSYLFELGKRP
ncbi:MAG TPA: hypothetical protein VE869_17435, partial [Gemmatimonas sp.]|nr:hypothetical protein [Gemmatimonas sp.]